MHHPRKTSKIAEWLDAQLDTAVIHDTDLGLSPCQTANAACILAPGIEHLFVTKTANYFVARLNDKLKANWLFQDLVYCPHQTIEKKCGFDLSVGHYQRPNRVRTMHKLHFGTKRVHPWPDENWTWSTSTGTKKERSRIQSHLTLLVDRYKEHAFYEPFLVLHLCFCVHEYRRMRDDGSNHTIPSFSDPLRTVVVDLRPLANAGYYDALKTNALSISIHHDHAQRNTQATLFGSGENVCLKILTLNELADHVVARVEIQF